MAAPEASCLPDTSDCYDPDYSQKLRIAAVFVILVASTLGVMLPALHKAIPWLHKERTLFQVLRSFGAGVILATGFVHMFPDASAALGSACLGWPATFPWAAFIALMTSLAVLLLESIVNVVVEGSTARKLQPRRGLHNSGAACTRTPGAGSLSQSGAPVGAMISPGAAHPLTAGDVESADGCASCEYNAGKEHISLSEVHGHDHSANPERMSPLEKEPETARHVAMAQVLEAGIAFHSVLIGLALGVTQSACTARALLAALVFHQFFEGFALGGCMVVADFRIISYVVMSCVFALTTPVGIAIGLGVSSTYNPNSKAALGTEGVFDSISTGILIYMALVDLIAVDFQSKRIRSSRKLQISAYLATFAGASCMSVLAIWA